jgi:MYXO-CTERM domain-containing protein
MVSHGYSFLGNGDGIYSCNAFLVGNNTTDAIVDANSQGIVTMQSVATGTFAVNSFWAGARNDVPWYYDIPTGLQVDGSVFGGGTVSATFALDGSLAYAFQQFFLPSSFDNLTSITWTALGDGQNNEFVLDDITVNGEFASTAPEPSTAALALTGLVGLGVVRRRRAA